MLTSLGSEPSNEQGEQDEQENRRALLHEAGRLHGAPDFCRRAYFRAVSDGRHKLVRWFSPQEYANPATLEDLYATADVALYDLEDDPGELENLAHPDHPRHDPALIQRMLDKLHALVRHEIGDDRCPFDLDMFGTREVRHRKAAEKAGPT
jgi:arylsulfatase